MIDEQKLRELANTLISEPVSRSISEIEAAGEFIKVLPDELQSLRSERTALLVNEQNLRASLGEPVAEVVTDRPTYRTKWLKHPRDLVGLKLYAIKEPT